jgi:hypothetical protein
MTYVAATADKIRSGYGISFSGPIALVIVAFTTAVGAWPVTWVSDSASSADFDPSSFDARFIPGATSNFRSMDFSRLVQSLPSELEIKLQQAKDRLAQKLQSQDRRVALMEEPTQSSVAAVPLPRPRPVEASLELRDSPLTAQPDNRTLLQKLSRRAPFTCQTG